MLLISNRLLLVEIFIMKYCSLSTHMDKMTNMLLYHVNSRIKLALRIETNKEIFPELLHVTSNVNSMERCSVYKYETMY